MTVTKTKQKASPAPRPPARLLRVPLWVDPPILFDFKLTRMYLRVLDCAALPTDDSPYGLIVPKDNHGTFNGATDLTKALTVLSTWGLVEPAPATPPGQTPRTWSVTYTGPTHPVAVEALFGTKLVHPDLTGGVYGYFRHHGKFIPLPTLVAFLSRFNNHTPVDWEPYASSDWQWNDEWRLFNATIDSLGGALQRVGRKAPFKFVIDWNAINVGTRLRPPVTPAVDETLAAVPLADLLSTYQASRALTIEVSSIFAGNLYRSPENWSAADIIAMMTFNPDWALGEQYSYVTDDPTPEMIQTFRDAAQADHIKREQQQLARAITERKFAQEIDRRLKANPDDFADNDLTWLADGLHLPDDSHLPAVITARAAAVHPAFIKTRLREHNVHGIYRDPLHVNRKVRMYGTAFDGQDRTILYLDATHLDKPATARLAKATTTVARRFNADIAIVDPAIAGRHKLDGSECYMLTISDTDDPYGHQPSYAHKHSYWRDDQPSRGPARLDDHSRRGRRWKSLHHRTWADRDANLWVQANFTGTVHEILDLAHTWWNARPAIATHGEPKAQAAARNYWDTQDGPVNTDYWSDDYPHW